MLTQLKVEITTILVTYHNTFLALLRFLSWGEGRTKLPKKERKMVFLLSMGGARTAWPKAGVISAVMMQTVMGHERLFCSGARPLNLWIPPTSSAPESDHYTLDGRDVAGGEGKNGHKMLVEKKKKQQACGKLAPISKKCFYPVSLQLPTCNTCKIYCFILFIGKNAPVSTNLIANVVNKAVRSFYISVLQLPQTTRASHLFVFHLTLGLNPRPSEFWLEGSEGTVPPPLNRHDSLCDCENIDMPRLLIVYASPFPTTESHTRQNNFQTNVMQNVLWCLNLYLGFAYCLKMPKI